METGLALLYHASVFFRFWDVAFQIACYFINLLLTPVLNNSSPFEKLFHTSPDYSLLKVFGCACWPNLRPYNSNKFQPRSFRCVFLGYSLRHKGYTCFHISTGRIYYSQDVVFDEIFFPFSSNFLLVQQPYLFAGTSTKVIQPIFAPIRATPLAQPHSRSSFAPLMAYAPFSSSIGPSLSNISPSPNPINNPIISPDSPASPNLGSVPVCPPNSPPSSTSQIDATSAPINPTNALPPPHPMLTHSRNNISKPKVFSDGTTRYLLPHALLVDGTCDSLTTEPTCFSQAVKHPH